MLRVNAIAYPQGHAVVRQPPLQGSAWSDDSWRYRFVILGTDQEGTNSAIGSRAVLILYPSIPDIGIIFSQGIRHLPLGLKIPAGQQAGNLCYRVLQIRLVEQVKAIGERIPIGVHRMGHDECWT